MNRKKRILQAILPLASVVVFIIVLTAIAGFVYVLFSSPSNSPLVKAAANGDMEYMKALLDAGTSIDSRCPFRNWTALHGAVANGQILTAQYLIGHGANLELKDDEGFTPLALAGCDSRGRPHDQDTEYGRNGIALILIQHAANVNAVTNRGLTPHQCAAEGHDQKLNMILMEHGGELTPDR